MTELGTQLKAQAAQSRRKTGLDAALERLSPQERKELVNAILDPMIPLQAISTVMRQRGIILSTHSIRKARRGEIVCEA
jgi:hypothetical protein